MERMPVLEASSRAERACTSAERRNAVGAPRNHDSFHTNKTGFGVLENQEGNPPLLPTITTRRTNRYERARLRRCASARSAKTLLRTSAAALMRSPAFAAVA